MIPQTRGSKRRRIVDQTCSARGGCESALELRRGREGATRSSDQGRQPDSGNPTVRDENGGLRKRDHGSRTEGRDESRGIATGPYRARAGVLSKYLPVRIWWGPRVGNCPGLPDTPIEPGSRPSAHAPFIRPSHPAASRAPSSCSRSCTRSSPRLSVPRALSLSSTVPGWPCIDETSSPPCSAC